MTWSALEVLGLVHGLCTARTHRTPGQPSRPRHDELRPADRRGRQPRHHGRGARRGHQLLRHRQRLRLRRRARAAPRRSSAPGSPGRRPPRQDRPCHQGLRRHERSRRTLAQPQQAVGGQHPPRRGRLAQAAPHRPHRHLPVPPRRPGHPVGGDLAGHRRPVTQGKILYAGSSNFPGCKIAAGQRGRRPHADGSASSASSASTTSPNAAPRWRSSRPPQEYGLGVIPWSPLHGGLLGGVLRKEREGAGCARSPGGRTRRLGDPSRAPRSRRTRICATNTACDPGDVAWPGCSPVPA